MNNALQLVTSLLSIWPEYQIYGEQNSNHTILLLPTIAQTTPAMNKQLYSVSSGPLEIGPELTILLD